MHRYLRTVFAGLIALGLCVPAQAASPLDSALDADTAEFNRTNNLATFDVFYFVPAAARASGSQGSFFFTDVDIQNAGDSMATFRLMWLPRDSDNFVPTFSDEFSLDPGHVMRWEDVLGHVFGFQDGTNALGALGVAADNSDLKIFSRTYNHTSSGTFGQAMPGFARDQMIATGETKRIMFLTENSDYRSNLGFVNGKAGLMTIKWRRYLPDGTMVEESSYDMPNLGNTQINRVFSGEAPVEGGYIDVWTDTPDAVFMAYGSVLDNNTSDPTTVLPQ